MSEWMFFIYTQFLEIDLELKYIILLKMGALNVLD